jgi:signal transduction histidine kinase
MGTFQIYPKSININDLVLETIEILKYSALDKNITITNLSSDIDIYADEECVKTVLRNLVNNAIKFTNRNGKIKIYFVEHEDSVQISVEDTGVGMSKEIADNIFGITKKTTTVGTENEKGSGLGLILCKDLIDKNNGERWVESEPDKGSTFSFTLPKGS